MAAAGNIQAAGDIALAGLDTAGIVPADKGLDIAGSAADIDLAEVAASGHTAGSSGHTAGPSGHTAGPSGHTAPASLPASLLRRTGRTQLLAARCFRISNIASKHFHHPKWNPISDTRVNLPSLKNMH